MSTIPLYCRRHGQDDCMSWFGVGMQEGKPSVKFLVLCIALT